MTKLKGFERGSCDLMNVLFRNFAKGTEEMQEKLQYDRCLDRCLEWKSTLICLRDMSYRQMKKIISSSGALGYTI